MNPAPTHYYCFAAGMPHFIIEILYGWLCKTDKLLGLAIVHHGDVLKYLISRVE